jgi:hypothetical protein
MAVRPRALCPVCGESTLQSVLLSHVGSARCLTKMHHDSGDCADPARGPEVLRLVRELGALLEGISL